MKLDTATRCRPMNQDFDRDASDGITTESAQAFLQELASLVSPAGNRNKQHSSEPPDIAARYRALVEQIPAVIFMAFLDQGLSEAYISPHVETILGFTQEQWLNDPIRWYNQIHPDDRARWSIEAAQLILSAQPLRSVYRVIARDGRVVWFRCEVKLVFAEDGRPWFIHGAAFDITDFKEAEAALQEAHNQLEVRVQERTAELAQVNRNLQLEVIERKRAEASLARTVEELTRSNADLKQFAYAASHDLQEPLRTIAIYGEWLRKEYSGKLDANGNQFVQYLSDAAQRMIAMIRDLLEYTQTANDSEGKSVSDANVVLANSLSDLQTLIQENQASIAYGPMPQVAILNIHLRQVFQNLVANAIKYRGVDPPSIRISATTCGRFALFSVADNGIGIAPEHQDKIFGIFQRLHSRDKYAGTGIGLAICKRIVERCGGRIWVESEPDKGTTFFFTLPLADEVGSEFRP
jgi:PAS domain S-box-containing protein